MLEIRKKIESSEYAAQNKALKSMDASICKIEAVIGNSTIKPLPETYYIVEYSFPESMGERGYSHTCFYDNIPTADEAKKDCIDEIKQFIEDHDNFWATAYEDRAVKILKIKTGLL